MSRNPRLIFASGLLLLAVLACNLPSSQSSSQPNLAATITAQAVLLETPTGTLASQTDTPVATGLEVSVSATTLPDYPTPAMSITNTPKPTKTPMPTKTPTLSSVSLTATMFAERPVRPGNLSGSRTCVSRIIASPSGFTKIWREAYTLTWTDNATNETEYQIQQNNAFVADLAANSTRYSNTFQYEQGGQSSDKFAVFAINSAGYDWASVVISRCS